MKNTFILLTILFFSNCKAQTVVPLDGSGPAESGYYYKDINNFLNTLKALIYTPTAIPRLKLYCKKR